MRISLWHKILSMPKTIYFNFKVLPFFSACQLPFFIYHKTKLVDISGKWIINNCQKRFEIQFGMAGAGTCIKDGSAIEMQGTIIFDGQCSFGGGCQICVNQDGVLEIGDKVRVTSECHIVCSKKIIIGNDTIISWRTQIMDCDMHMLMENQKRINEDQEVVIGKHCWICSDVALQKGSVLPDNSIIAQGAVINCRLDEQNCIYTGLPVKKLKSNIAWQ